MLNGVSFSVHPGEVLGVAALEGQGQEELFECIAGVRRPDSGAILSEGRELSFGHPADAIREGFVLVPANRLQALLQQRSIRENVGLPAFRRASRWGPIAMGAERDRVESAVKRLQIDTRAESETRRLSGGNQQKVVIARWVAHGSKRCSASTRRAASISVRSIRSTPWCGSWRQPVLGSAIHLRAARDSLGL